MVVKSASEGSGGYDGILVYLGLKASGHNTTTHIILIIHMANESTTRHDAKSPEHTPKQEPLRDWRRIAYSGIGFAPPRSPLHREVGLISISIYAHNARPARTACLVLVRQGPLHLSSPQTRPLTTNRYPSINPSARPSSVQRMRWR
jgi:hypothetical protein